MELLKRSLFKSDEAIKLLFHGDAFVPKIQQALQSTVEVAKLSSGRYIKWIFPCFNDQVVANTNADYTPLDIATSKTVDGRYFAT